MMKKSIMSLVISCLVWSCTSSDQQRIEKLKTRTHRISNPNSLREEIAFLTRKLEENPNDNFLLMVRAQDYVGLQEYEKSLADYLKVDTSKVEDKSYFYDGIAHNLNFLGRYEEAIHTINIAINNGVPMTSALYFQKAFSNQFLGKYSKALININKSINLDSSKSEYFNNRGIIYIYLARYGEACADFVKAREMGFPVDEKNIYNVYCK